jgi:hypothetical protein
MANRNPSNHVASLFDRSLGALASGRTTPDQVVTETLASLLGTSGASSAGTGPNSALTNQLTTIAQQLQQLQTINQTQIETMQDNTRAVDQNSTTRGPSGGSTASSIGNTLQTIFGFGLGLSPLISGLVSLFGGGGSSQPAPPSPFIMPLPVRANAGISASSPVAFAADSADGGLPRPAPAAPPAQITVQVQAMDSRSFLDHSNDIALAVRQAMLETSVLNDVIREV